MKVVWGHIQWSPLLLLSIYGGAAPQPLHPCLKVFQAAWFGSRNYIQSLINRKNFLQQFNENTAWTCSEYAKTDKEDISVVPDTLNVNQETYRHTCVNNLPKVETWLVYWLGIGPITLWSHSECTNHYIIMPHSAAVLVHAWGCNLRDCAIAETTLFTKSFLNRCLLSYM